MNTTILYNRAAEYINHTCKREVVTTCQIPKGKFDNYFKHGVALRVESYDDYKLLMRSFEDIAIGEVTVYLEPYNTTFIGVWED